MSKFRTVAWTLLALALTASLLSLTGSSQADAQGAAQTTAEFASRGAPTHFQPGQRYLSEAESVAIANNHDLVIGHWNAFGDHVPAMKAANPDVTVLVYKKGATAPDFAATTYPDSWYLRDAQGDKVVTDPWGSFLMDPREQGWRDTIVDDCLAEIEAIGYDGCYFDVMGTGALGIAATPPVFEPGGPEITREEWHAQMLEMTTYVRETLPASMSAMSNSLTSGRRYFDVRYPSAELADAMGYAHAEVWQRTGFSDVDQFRSLPEFRWELEMLTDASSRGNRLFLTTKLWKAADEATRSQWRNFSYASFLLADDGTHYFGFTGEQQTFELEHPLYEFNIGVPTGSYAEQSGVFQRAFTDGRVIVNANDSIRTISLPSGDFVDANGQPHNGAIQLGAHQGVLLQKNDPDPTPTPSPTPTVAATPTPTPTATPGDGGGSSLSGVITLLADDSPIFAAQVCAVRAFPPAESCVYSQVDGSYLITDLGPGNYSVVASDVLGRYLENCAGTNPCTQPTFFSLGASSSLSDVDVALDPAFNATNPTPTPAPNTDGSISGNVTRGGSPTSSIEVCAVDIFGSSVNCAMTNASGDYTISGLATSNYRVEFEGAGMCYKQRVGCVSFVPVGVVAPGARTGIDADLPSGINAF